MIPTVTVYSSSKSGANKARMLLTVSLEGRQESTWIQTYPKCWRTRLRSVNGVKGRKRDPVDRNEAEAAHSITVTTITVLGRLVLLVTRHPVEVDTLPLVVVDMDQVEAEALAAESDREMTTNAIFVVNLVTSSRAAHQRNRNRCS